MPGINNKKVYGVNILRNCRGVVNKNKKCRGRVRKMRKLLGDRGLKNYRKAVRLRSRVVRANGPGGKCATTFSHGLWKYYLWLYFMKTCIILNFCHIETYFMIYY